jgi:hypothetical protein
LSRFAREAGTGCARAATIRIVAVIVVVPLFCILILLPLGLAIQTEVHPGWLAVPAGLFLLLLFGGGFGALAWILARRRKHLDAVCTPLGLRGSLYQMFFRQYHGEAAGRRVAVYFYRGPAVEVEVETSLPTRFAVTEGDAETAFLARLFDRQPLALDDAALDGLAVMGLDEGWARQLLAQPEVPALLRRLVTFPGTYTRRHVILRPGSLRLFLFGSGRLLDFSFDVTPEGFRSWVEDLLALVQAAEALPAPAITDEETSAERLARGLRERNPYLLPAITAGAVGVFFCLAVVIAVVAVLLASGG